MTVLGLKRWRDLRAQRGPSLAVAAVMALGVMLFVTSAGAYRDLRDSYASTRRQLALAGLHVDVAGPLAAADVDRVAALPGVAVAEERLVAEVPVSPSPEGDRRAALRVLSLPDEGEPRLDRVLLLEGGWPGPGEVVLEKHFARHHGLGAGSTLRRGGGDALRVSGVGVSAEYLWVTRSENDFMPSPDEFGVGWMRRAALEAVAGERATQLLVEPRPGHAARAVASSVREALGEERVARVTPSDELVGVRVLQMDVDGYQGMAAFFPIFFLGVGTFIMGSVLARQVDAQRALVGTFLALGVKRGAMLRHYVGYALLLGLGGAIAGGALGLASSPAMTKAYAEELNIPFVEAGLHLDLVVVGLLLAAAAAAVSGLLPAVRAMMLSPAEAMRPAAPAVSGVARALRNLPAPLPLQLAVRDIVERPLRSAATVLGVAAAVMLVLTTGGLMDSMRLTFSSLFERALRYDVRVDFAAPVDAEDALRRARAVAGAERAEAYLVVPARLEAHGAREEALVQALDDGAELVRAVDADGSIARTARGGLVLTRHAARKLGLSVGDSVQMTSLVGGDAVSLRLAGFADGAMGNTATARRGDLDGPWHLAGLTTSVVVRAPRESAAVRARLAETFPEAARVEDTATTRVQFDQLMGLGWVMVVLMLVFGGMLAGAILFTTATLLVLERQREIATLRALGLRAREVVSMVTIQHGVLTLVGLAAGIPLAVLASQALCRAFSSELFALPFTLGGPTVATAVLGVVAVVWLAQGPALRRVGRTSLAEAVRVHD